jgi:HPr kinase/phosphorylase
MSSERTIQSTIIHASCVSVNGNGMLILGPSGAGKSWLALEMMALGASLVADDRCVLDVVDDRLIASAPDTIAGKIEARGVGILNAAHVPQAHVQFIVDLSEIETARLPEAQSRKIMGVTTPLYGKPEQGLHAAAYLQLLKAGRHA